MRMVSSRRSGLLDLAEMRLPLIALIDVILFLLMYFLLAGSLESEERELASALGSGTSVSGDSGGFTPQAIEVTVQGGTTVFRMGTTTSPSTTRRRRCRCAAMPDSGKLHTSRWHGRLNSLIKLPQSTPERRFHHSTRGGGRDFRLSALLLWRNAAFSGGSVARRAAAVVSRLRISKDPP